MIACTIPFVETSEELCLAIYAVVGLICVVIVYRVGGIC